MLHLGISSMISDANGTKILRFFLFFIFMKGNCCWMVGCDWAKRKLQFQKMRNNDNAFQFRNRVGKLNPSLVHGFLSLFLPEPFLWAKYKCWPTFCWKSQIKVESDFFFHRNELVMNFEISFMVGWPQSYTLSQPEMNSFKKFVMAEKKIWAKKIVIWNCVSKIWTQEKLVNSW